MDTRNSLFRILAFGLILIASAQPAQGIAYFVREVDHGLDTFAVGVTGEENGSSYANASNVTDTLGVFYVSSYNKTSNDYDTSFGTVLDDFPLEYGKGYWIYSTRLTVDLDFYLSEFPSTTVNYTITKGLNFCSNPLPVPVWASEFTYNNEMADVNPNIFYVAIYNQTSDGYDVYFPNPSMSGDFQIPGCSAVWVYLTANTNINFTYVGYT